MKESKAITIDKNLGNKIEQAVAKLECMTIIDGKLFIKYDSIKVELLKNNNLSFIFSFEGEDVAHICSNTVVCKGDSITLEGLEGVLKYTLIHS